jgi:glycine cleavage system aminomethyltransferase T
MKRFVAAVGACLLLEGAACSSISFVDEVTIVNDTEYSANVDVTGKARDGWLGLTVVGPQSTTTVEEVIDQGEVWIFRFDYVGNEEDVEISRRELEGRDWTIEVPRSFGQQLRDLDVPPPP